MAPEELPRISSNSHPSRMWFFVSVVFFCTLGGFGGGWVASVLRSNQTTNNSSQANQRVVTSESEVIADVADKVSPSVVSIVVSAAQAGTFGSIATSQSAGTGIIVKEDGLILTNKHVIAAGATKITVTTSDNTKYSEVDIVGRDPLNDIAYIKVKNPKGFKAAKLGDSDKVRVGDKVVAIGNALGEFNNSVTAGIISAKNRPVSARDANQSEQLSNLIQTDAAINEGNSGGPLVNISGEVVGMNTALAGDAQNIGFSIPINDIKPGLESVEKTGKFERPYLGVRYVSLTKDVASQLNLPVSDGAYVDGTSSQGAVVSGSPAEKAGIQEGDIITKVDDTTLTATNQLTNVLARKRVGDKVKITYLRGGKTSTVTVTLESAPSQ